MLCHKYREYIETSSKKTSFFFIQSNSLIYLDDDDVYLSKILWRTVKFMIQPFSSEYSFVVWKKDIRIFLSTRVFFSPVLIYQIRSSIYTSDYNAIVSGIRICCVAIPFIEIGMFDFRHLISGLKSVFILSVAHFFTGN